MDSSFVEISVFQVKPDKTAEFEGFIENLRFYLEKFDDVLDIKVMKRTHRIKDYESIKNGEPPLEIKRIIKSVKYVLYWELNDELAYGRINKMVFAEFRKELNRILIVPEDKYLGERIV